MCELYETYVDELLTVAVHLLRDVPLAEDVVQDVFIAFARVAPSFRLTGSLRAYLVTCTANRARDAIRRRNRRGECGLDDCDAIGHTDKGPLESAVQAEQRDQLQKALAELPYDQREAIVLRLHGQMKFRQNRRGPGCLHQNGPKPLPLRPSEAPGIAQQRGAA